jgi:hypothetical protein
MPGTRRIDPVFRGRTPQGPLTDGENNNDLVDWLKGLGQAWQNVVKGFGAAESSLRGGGTAGTTRQLTQAELAAQKRLADEATRSKMGYLSQSKNDFRRSRGR